MSEENANDINTNITNKNVENDNFAVKLFEYHRWLESLTDEQRKIITKGTNEDISFILSDTLSRFTYEANKNLSNEFLRAEQKRFIIEKRTKEISRNLIEIEHSISDIEEIIKNIIMDVDELYHVYHKYIPFNKSNFSMRHIQTKICDVKDNISKMIKYMPYRMSSDGEMRQRDTNEIFDMK